MSYITFGANDTVYIRGIGYATLLNCGARNTLSQKIDSLPQKKQSLVFDPDLFNSDGDSNHSKKSQHKSEDERPEKKLVEVIAETTTEEVKPQREKERREKEKKEEGENVNIVQARLQGSNAVVYTSDRNVTKSITIIVKSLLINHREQVVVDIEINRNIDTLKKMVFQQLGQTMNNYFNIRLFSTLPLLGELSVHSKTIIQCQLKDMAQVILTAQYAFSFRSVLSDGNSKNKVKLTNQLTLNSNRAAEEPKKIDSKAVIPLPPPPVEEKEKEEDKKEDEKKKSESQAEQKEGDKKEDETKEEPIDKGIEKKESGIAENKFTEGPYCSKCTVEFSSGRRYWEIKVEKLPTDEDDLIIGVCVDSDSKEAEDSCWGCDYAWGYQAVSGKKMLLERDWESNTFDEESEPYGYSIRQNDTLGILLTFKGRTARIVFYKNSISCGQAFSIDLEGLKSERRQLVPFVAIGGDSQVTLDSKAMQPLDSYRLR